MFETGIERTVIGTAIVFWFAHGWYLNNQLRQVHQKLDRMLECFDGLREYLYEIDTQFDDERKSNKAVFGDSQPFAAMDDIALLDRKIAVGRRTLNSTFHSR